MQLSTQIMPNLKQSGIDTSCVNATDRALTLDNKNIQAEERGAQKPFFSIIIPVYNVAAYLRDCLDSVAAQTYGNWECICVDDGSTDGSGEILDEYAAKDAHFRVFHQENTGVSAARNQALDEAQGQWVWFVDSDDMIHPESLAWLERRILKDPTIAALSIATWKETEAYIGRWAELPKTDGEVTEKHTSQSLRMRRHSVGTTLINREYLGTLRFEPFAIGEDVLFQLTFGWSHPKLRMAPAPLYAYRIRSDSAVHKRPTVRTVTDFFETELRILKLFEEHKNAWRDNHVVEFINWDRHHTWCTFKNCFFLLKLRDAQKLLPQWCKLQEAFHKIFGATLVQRLTVRLIARTNCILLCHVFIPWRDNSLILAQKMGIYPFVRDLKHRLFSR